tara:strand:- start:406 stop:1083 length:678 start_codon:yes stop_codon:yes gene_type:complete
MKNIIPAETSKQIKSLNINTNIPLIISDADEVLFLFLKGFEKFLKSKNLYLDLEKARLTGSIKKISDNTPVPDDSMSKLLPEFFLKETKKLEPVIDAENCLKILSKKAQIIILTNIPFKDKKSRVHALKKYNMNYPVITNSGLKGPVVSEICKGMKAPVFFIDDLGQNLESVKKEYKKAICIHFLQDIRLQKLMMTPNNIKHRLTNWLEVKKLINKEILFYENKK